MGKSAIIEEAVRYLIYQSARPRAVVQALSGVRFPLFGCSAAKPLNGKGPFVASMPEAYSYVLADVSSADMLSRFLSQRKLTA